MKYELERIFEQHAIVGICCDSKKIKPNQAFFAMRGGKLNGNDFIEEALANGAKIVISDSKLYDKGQNSQITNEKIIYVDDVKAALNEAINILYPNLPDNLAAVTGTNGKTSVVAYCKQLLALLDQKSASVGTLGVDCSDAHYNKLFEGEIYKSLTTPDVISFRMIMNILANNNINYVMFEASSHGLAQNRLKNIEIKVAAFTSFSPDHLDYHQSMEQYLKAKLKLFTDNLVEGGTAIVTSEIAELQSIEHFFNLNNVKYITVGSNGHLKVKTSNQSIFGQIVEFSWLGKDYNFSTEIIGSFQASNLLIAALVVNNLGFAFEDIINKMHMLRAVGGRLERITKINDLYSIFVDYAHTPDALDKSLKELKKLLPSGGRLHVMFGCGGNRDSSKRAVMGRIASQIADNIIITDDNPRYEDPQQIRNQILSATSGAWEVGDRKEAIALAVSKLQPKDILLIAGKGHENYQIFGNNKLPFCDREITKAILKSYKK